MYFKGLTLFENYPRKGRKMKEYKMRFIYMIDIERFNSTIYNYCFKVIFRILFYRQKCCYRILFLH